MIYKVFKGIMRSRYPNKSCSDIKRLHQLLYPEQYTIADTEVCQQTQQEVDQTMFDNDCEEAPRVKMRNVIANAQIVNNAPVEATQRDYATARIKAIGEKHNKALRKQFHLDYERPPTAAALIAAIKGDNYTLDLVKLAAHADDIKRGYYNNDFGIVWGPAPDIDGYNVAVDILKAAAQKALDGASLKTIDALEGVIDDFEAWVYTPAS